MKPSPRHSKCGRSSKTSRHHLERAQVALVRHHAPVLVLDLTATLRQLPEDHLDRLEHVERLEARDHDRPAVVGGYELERPRADHRADVAGTDEAVEAQVGRVEQCTKRRHDRHVVAHAREVLDALGLGALEGQRRRGRCGLEADREEDDLAVGVLLRDPERVERRVDHPYVGALGFGVEQASVRARDPHHVAEAREDHALGVREGDAVVHPAHRDHTDGAAGTMHELDVLGEQVVDCILVNRVGVPAAHLHHLVVTAGLDEREDLAGDGAAELGVAELVDVLHPAPAARGS